MTPVIPILPPQRHRVPSVFRATLWTSPALAVTNPDPIWTGSTMLPPAPAASPPLSLSPQIQRVPSDFTATVWA